MKLQRVSSFAAAIAVACLLFAGLVITIQPANATPGSMTPLNSPLSSPLTIPDDPQPDTTEISFTPTYMVYIPIVSRFPNNKFGTEVDSAFDDGNGASYIEKAGFSWYRHLQMDWARHEPTPTQYITTPTAWDGALDDGIVRATSSGLKTIILIRDSPAWATTSGYAGCSPIKPGAYITFASFVDWVISKYEKAPYYVKYYELSNEPDSIPQYITNTEMGCWASAYDYASMLTVVYPLVKNNHPEANIMNGGFASMGSWQQSFVVTGLNYIDTLAYHAYDVIDPGESMWNHATQSRPALYLNRLDQIRSWISATNQSRLGIDVMMNEGALITQSASIVITDLRRSQAYFAAFMSAQVIGEDLEQYSWWSSRTNLFNSNFGEISGSVYVTNSVYTALAFAFDKVYHAIPYTTTRNSSGASIIKVYDSRGTELWLMWNTNGSQSTAFTHDFGFTPYMVWDVWGNNLAITSTLVMTDPNKVVWVQPYE